ncbi:MAG: MBL fold metallo-hydrolase [Bacteroidales bacterium]|nr:MBL fold metallo-hydrolase [Bacteroidales bacterium]
MKLKILVDNCVDQPDVKGELGFSIYIEHQGFKVLFDLGQSNIFEENAKLFNIDISSIDALVLSHGHYDHTGGLNRFLELNSKAKIYLKGGVAFNKYNTNGKYIGIPQKVNIPEERLVSVSETTIELAEGIYIVPNIKLYDHSDTHFDHFIVGDEMMDDRHDYFLDEQFVTLVQDGKMTIVNGCAHRGIINIIQSAISEFSLPLRYVIGGFHTRHENEEFMTNLAKKLNLYDIEKIVTCHCTGMNQYSILKRDCKTNVEYGFVGKSIVID